MSIAETCEKCKNALARIPRDALVLAILVLSSSASFGLGYLTGLDVRKADVVPLEPAPADAPAAAGQVVASKNGTKYYLPDCAGAGRISEANKVWFASPAAASAAGYAPAANCAGL